MPRAARLPRYPLAGGCPGRMSTVIPALPPQVGTQKGGNPQKWGITPEAARGRVMTPDPRPGSGHPRGGSGRTATPRQKAYERGLESMPLRAYAHSGYQSRPSTRGIAVYFTLVLPSIPLLPLPTSSLCWVAMRCFFHVYGYRPVCRQYGRTPLVGTIAQQYLFYFR
jgi:hypothetical protein